MTFLFVCIYYNNTFIFVYMLIGKGLEGQTPNSEEWISMEREREVDDSIISRSSTALVSSLSFCRFGLCIL